MTYVLFMTELYDFDHFSDNRIEWVIDIWNTLNCKQRENIRAAYLN